MNRSKIALLVLTLAMIGGVGAGLNHFHRHQKLGLPGVKTSPIPGDIRLRVELPEQVLDYKSEWFEPDEVTTNTLPRDTSFGIRRYTAPDGFGLLMQAVLMGVDRTSLHKPQFCLEGQGWRIDDTAAELSSVHIGGAQGYDLPVMKLQADKVVEQNGQRQVQRCLYVYWYVADGSLSAGTLGIERMKAMACELVLTGVLQRWAYLSCLVPCAPGQEAEAFERAKQFIAAAVPQFQTPPKRAQAQAAPQP